MSYFFSLLIVALWCPKGFTDKTLSFYFSQKLSYAESQQWCLSHPYLAQLIRKTWTKFLMEIYNFGTVRADFGRNNTYRLQFYFLGELGFYFDMSEPRGEAAYVSFRNQVRRSSGSVS